MWWGGGALAKNIGGKGRGWQKKLGVGAGATKKYWGGGARSRQKLTNINQHSGVANIQVKHHARPPVTNM